VDFAPTETPPPSKLPPSIHLAEAPRLDSMPGAGYPTHTTAVGAISRVGSSPGATHTAVEGRPRRLLIAILPWIVAAAVSEQNRLLSSSRSCRKKPLSIWWSMERVLALLDTGHGATPEPCLAEGRWRRKSSGRSIRIARSRLERRIPLRFIKILPLI
jgi:hypothetical protein